MRFEWIEFSKHALVRSKEWQYDADTKEVLEKGFHCISDRDPSCKLCIYKVREQYFTLVCREIGKGVLIITLHHSNPKEIKMAEGRWKL